MEYVPGYATINGSHNGRVTASKGKVYPAAKKADVSCTIAASRGRSNVAVLAVAIARVGELSLFAYKLAV